MTKEQKECLKELQKEVIEMAKLFTLITRKNVKIQQGIQQVLIEHV